MSLNIFDNVIVTLILFTIYLKIKRFAKSRYIRIKAKKIFFLRYMLLFIAYVFHVMSVVSGAWTIFTIIYYFM